MARFGKKCVLLVLLAIVLISVAVRYPLVEHERHNDTYLMRLLATSISSDGYAVWTFHPLSYFGYYPVSYPSGVPFLLSGISEAAGIGMSLSILLLNAFTGILFALAVFCLSRELVQRVDIAMLAAFLAVLGPRFVDTSYWNGSARAPFIVLAVLVVIVARRAGVSGQPAYFLILGLALFGSFAVHHMAVLFVLFGVAYVLSTLTSRMVYGRRLSRMSRSGRRRLAGMVVVGIALSVLLVSALQFSYFKQDLEYGFASTSIFSFEPVYLSIMLNLAGSYTNQIGFILPIAVIGIPFCFARMRLSATFLFPIFLVLVFIPLLPSALYITMVLLPYVAILGSHWFAIALKRSKFRRMVVALLGVLICISLVLPGISLARWNSVQEKTGDAVVPDDQLFADGAYLAQYSAGSFAISNNKVLATRLGGVSGVIFLDSGVVSTLTGDVTADSVRGNLSWMEARFPYNLYLWFEYEADRRIEPVVIVYVLQGSSFPAGPGDTLQSGDEYFEGHSRLLVVVDNKWPASFAWVWASLPAKLPGELRDAEWTYGGRTMPLDSYSVYASESVTLYATEVPNQYA